MKIVVFSDKDLYIPGAIYATDDSHYFYSNTLYIISQNIDKNSRLIKKYARNYIIVEVYKDDSFAITTKNSKVFQGFSFSNIDTEEINFEIRPEYQHLVQKYSSIDEDFILNEELNEDQITYLEKCNVLYHYDGFLYLNLQTLSREIINNSNNPLIQGIMMKNNLLFEKNGEIIIPELLPELNHSLTSKKHYFYISQEEFHKIMCMFKPDICYKNYFEIKNKFALFYRGRTYLIIYDEKIGKQIEYYLNSLEKYTYINSNISMIARINNDRYFKFFLNEDFDLKESFYSIVFETAEEISQNDLNNLKLKEIPYLKTPTKINGEYLSNFQWIGYDISKHKNENMEEYLDIYNTVKYCYKNYVNKADKIDFNYIKDLCHNLSYQEKQIKNLLKVNIIGNVIDDQKDFIRKLQKNNIISDKSLNEDVNIQNNSFFFSNKLIIFQGMNFYNYLFRDNDLFLVFLNIKKDAINTEILFVKEEFQKKYPNSKFFLIYSNIFDSRSDFYSRYDRKEENALFIDIPSNHNMHLITDILLEQIKNNSYLIPKSYEIIYNNLKLLEDFVLDEDSFYEMIQGVDDKDLLINYLTKIGILFKYENNFIIMNNVFFDKIDTLKKPVYPKEEFDRKYGFMKNYFLNNKVIFEREDHVYIPKFLNMSYDAFIKNEKIRISNKYKFCVEVPKILYLFSNYLILDELKFFDFKLKIDDDIYQLKLQYDYLYIFFSTHNNENLSKILQVLFSVVDSVDYLKYGIMRTEAIIGKLNNEDTIYNVFTPFLNLNFHSAIHQVFNFTNYNYVNLEKIIPPGKILYLVYEDSYGVPVSKSTDIFNLWNIGYEYIKKVDKLRKITIYEREVLSQMTNLNISEFEYLYFEDGYEDQIFQKYENCFGNIDYIFRDIRIEKRISVIQKKEELLSDNTKFQLTNLNRKILTEEQNLYYYLRNLLLTDSSNISFVKNKLGMNISDDKVLDFLTNEIRSIYEDQYMINYGEPNKTKLLKLLKNEFSENPYYLEQLKNLEDLENFLTYVNKKYKKRFSLVNKGLYYKVYALLNNDLVGVKNVIFNAEEINNFLKLNKFLKSTNYFHELRENVLLVEYNLLDEIFI